MERIAASNTREDRALSGVAMGGAVVGAVGGAALGAAAGGEYLALGGTLGTVFVSGLAACGWSLLARLWANLSVAKQTAPRHNRVSEAVTPAPSAG
jgi:hypothetical protein